MKVLIIGTTKKKHRTEYYIRRAFERAGHRVYGFDNNRWHQFLGSGMRLMLCAAVSRVRPDLILTTKGRYLTRSTMSTMSRKTRCVMWYFDAHDNPPKAVLELASAVETLFLTNKGQMEAYQNAGAKTTCFLPQACDSEYHRPMRHESEEPYEVSFVGNALSSPYRYALLSELSEQFDVHLWGQRNTEPVGNCTVHPFHVANQDLARVVNQSKVVLGCHAFESLNTLHSYASNRVWLTLACGGFFLGHDTPGMRTVIPAGKYCEYYDSIEDLISKIKYYTARPELRHRIRSAASAWVHSSHTFDHRLRNILGSTAYSPDETTT